MEDFITDDNLRVVLRIREKQRLQTKWEGLLQPQAQKHAVPKAYRLLTKYAVAASIIILIIAASVTIFWQTTPKANKALALAQTYDDSFEKPYLSGQTMNQDNVTPLLDSLSTAYKNNNFSTTIKWINILPDSIIEQRGLRQIKAYSHFKLNQLEIAIQEFQLFLESPNHSHDDALWYLALAYLQLNPPNIQAAQDALEKAQMYQPKKIQATKLLIELKELNQ